MNTQPVDDDNQVYGMSRDEYVKRAKQSCLINYYGDKMKSKDEILKEIAMKKKVEDQQLRQTTEFHSSSTVIPFTESRKNRNNISSLTMDQEQNLKSEIDTMLTPDINSTQSNEPEINNNYVNDFTQAYHSQEPENFVTSIQNARPDITSNDRDAKDVKSLRLFGVRCAIAFLLLAGIIVVDKFNLSYKGYGADKIQQLVVEQNDFDQIENIIASMASGGNK